MHTYIHTTKFIQRQNREERIRGETFFWWLQYWTKNR